MADLWPVALLVLLTVTSGLWGGYVLRQEARRRLLDLLEAPGRHGTDGEQARRTGAGAGRGAASGPAGGGLLARVGGWLRPVLPGTLVGDLRWRLLWAGRPLGWTPEEFLAGRVALALVLGALGWSLAGNQPVGTPARVAFPIALVAFGLYLPEFWLSMRISARRRQIDKELLLYLDLVATVVEAGLGLGEAVRRVAEVLPGLVALEFMRTQQEMSAGKPRQTAWRDLIDRSPSQDLRAAVLSIMQAEQYGTSVVEQIRSHVRHLRSERQRRAQEIAQAAAVKMRVPMLIFIMLPFLALVLGPAFLSLSQLLLK